MSTNAWSKEVYNDFFKNTVSAYSKATKRQIRKLMIENHLITPDPQTKFEDSESIALVESGDDEEFIASVCRNDLAFFFEYWEFIKLYKYSVPFCYEGDINSLKRRIADRFVLTEKTCTMNTFGPDMENSFCSYYEEADYIYIKFVTQKTYHDSITLDTIDYRYPVVVAINQNNNWGEIRYDSLKFDNSSSSSNQSFYWSVVDYIIDWIKKSEDVKVYNIESKDTIDKIKGDISGDGKRCKQLMEVKSGAVAELQTSESGDYVLPFIGELRELIDENEALFDNSPKIKELLIDYLNDKEATSSYPYIYVKWIKLVDSQSYIVKIVFPSPMRNMLQMQHITAKCTNLRKERMNDAIEYLFTSGSFMQGKEL